MNDPLSELPIDLLTDIPLPICNPSDLVAISRTCKRWYEFLTSEGGACEIVFKRRAALDFHFPVGASGRRSGWYQLYGRLSRSEAMVWGQNGNGRLGLRFGSFRLPALLRPCLIQGGMPIPTRLELPEPPVAIVAGGWSFHVLSSQGRVTSWGMLDGGAFGNEDAPLSNPGRVLRPQVLPQSKQIGEVKQLEAGRAHIILLGRDGKVWELYSFGRAAKVQDESGRWGTVAGASSRDETGVKAVQAGWDYSAVLTYSGDVYVWWQPGAAPLGRAAQAAGEDNLASPSSEGVSFPLPLDTLRLPPLPTSSTFPDDKIEVIACGDNFVIALTRSSQLYYLDLSPVPEPQQPFAGKGARSDPEDSPTRSRASVERLSAAFIAGRRGWKRMSRFCEGRSRITHISAHFKSFAAYSVSSSADPAGSVVLLGNNDWSEEAEPQIMPELQDLGVIKVAHSDYHSLTLTSDGRLFSWGAFSAGALGLGHPQLSNTPLSAPHPPPTPAYTPAQPPQPFPPPQLVAAAPNFVRRPAQPPTLFNGIFPARQAVAIPQPPQRVDKPTRVRFHGESSVDATSSTSGASGERRRGKFVYAIAAAGWHSGCLAVDLSSDSSSSIDEPTIPLPRSAADEEEAEPQRIAGQAAVESVNGGRSWTARLGRDVRIGLAGRGAGGGGAADPQA